MHLGGYLLTVTMINVGVGIATGIVCAVTGMPNPAGLGALAATLNFLPIIGPVAMFVILTVVGIIAFPTLHRGPDRAAGLCRNHLPGGAFRHADHHRPPALAERARGLLALAFWTWLWGPVGGFLSSPLLIVALILKEHLMPVDMPQLPQD